MLPPAHRLLDAPALPAGCVAPHGLQESGLPAARSALTRATARTSARARAAATAADAAARRLRSRVLRRARDPCALVLVCCGEHFLSVGGGQRSVGSVRWRGCCVVRIQRTGLRAGGGSCRGGRGGPGVRAREAPRGRT